MDNISDMLTQIRNALAAKKAVISIPFSNFKQNLGELLVKNDCLKSITRVGRGPKKYLKIELLYGENGKPAIESLKKISKPGQKIYSGKSEIKPVKSGLGFTVVSTSKGLMTDKEARKNGLGGELICEIF